VNEDLVGGTAEGTPGAQSPAVPPPVGGGAQPEAEGAPEPAAVAAGATPPEPIVTPPQPKRYTSRFVVAYVGLGVALAAAITGLIVLVIRPGHHAPPPWSSWKPPSGSTSAMTKAVADHVSHQYHLDQSGSQLLAVVPSKATVTSGTSTIQIKAVAVRKAPQSNTGIAVLDASKTEIYQLCGLGTNCSIAKGQATATRGRLVRREALELALYTFKFVPAVDSVAAFMPPPPGQTANTMLYLQKSDLQEQLREPLSKTLVLPKPPLPASPDKAEAPTIDKLTLPHLFTYSLTALQGGGAALILDPAQ
jgi:hypothetical protein